MEYINTKDKMAAEVISSKKSYLKRLVIIVLCLLLLYPLFQFLFHPSQHLYFLLPTRESVIIFSLVGIIVVFLGILLLIMGLLKRGILRIDEEGIYNDFWLYNKKLVKWEEIQNINSVQYNRTRYLTINLLQKKNEEKGIKFLIFSVNKATIGTPYFINDGLFDLNFEDLQTLVTDNFIKKSSN